MDPEMIHVNLSIIPGQMVLILTHSVATNYVGVICFYFSSDSAWF